MTTSTISHADAKATLSKVVSDTATKGRRYVITVRNVPKAMIVPIPKPMPQTASAFGMLAGLRPAATRSLEREAYAEALEERYANPS